MPVDYAGHDFLLAEECELELPDGELVNFQFPPRILSDNRKGNWNEGDLRGEEPVAVFKNSGPREMTMSWTYIVDGAEWTTENVVYEIKKVRGYFANVLEADARQRSLICGFKYGLYGDQSRFSARIKSIDVKHSDTLVMPSDGFNVDTTLAFPLRTDVTIDLRLWTKGGANKTQDLERLVVELTPAWY
jgi:hypothetical protein